MEQFIEKMAEVLERDSVNPDDNFRDYEEWDSLAYMAVVAMVDDEYDMVISGDDFANLNKIVDIYHYINNNH
jgi:acyl carrier protein